jgi:hypothetical protein
VDTLRRKQEALEDEIDPDEAARRVVLIQDFTESMLNEDKISAWSDFSSYMEYLYDNEKISDYLGQLIELNWTPPEVFEDWNKDVDAVVKFVDRILEVQLVNVEKNRTLEFISTLLYN